MIENTVEQNEVFGNSNGIYLAAGVQGNIIRGNTVVGNPPVQVAADHSLNGGADIKNMATAGSNVFEENVCVIGLNAPCPTVTPTASTRLEGQLQSSVCGTFPPAKSCEVSVSVWNYYLVNVVNSDAKALVLGDGTQVMTVQQYLAARAAAGL